jgi:hypothetical protein
LLVSLMSPCEAHTGEGNPEEREYSGFGGVDLLPNH